MPTQVRAPDGTLVNFPDGMSDDQISAAMAKNYPPTNAAPAAPSGPSAAWRAAHPIQAGLADFANSNFAQSMAAGTHEAVNSGTFGLADKASAALYSALSQHPAGQALLKEIGAGGTPATYDQAKAAAAQGQADQRTAHPTASLVGDVAGAVEGGGAIADAIKGARALPGVGRVVGGAVDALSPTEAAQGAGAVAKTGNAIANVAKSAAVGATVGGGTAALQGENGDQITEAALGGAVLNPAVSKVAGVIAKAAQPVISKGMLLLAQKLGETPETLQAASDNFLKFTGQPAPIAALVGAKSQGTLASLAADNSTIGEAMNNAAQRFDQQATTTLPQRVQAVTGNAPQSISDLTQARERTMTSAMAPIRSQPVTLDNSHLDLLTDPALRDATSPPVLSGLRSRVNQAVGDIDASGSSNALSIGDVDTLRQSLGSRQAAFANPSNPNANSGAAQAAGDLRGRIAGLVDSGTPEGADYHNALDQFTQDSQHINGFKHGVAGKLVSEADDPSLIRDLASPSGQAGYQSGVSTRLQNQAGDTTSGAANAAGAVQEPGAQANLSQTFSPGQAQDVAQTGAAIQQGSNALNRIAPGGINPEDNPANGARQAAQTIGATVAHSPASTVFHLMKTVPSFGKLSQGMQDSISKALTDPAQAQNAINALKKAGATRQQLRDLALSIGGTATAEVAPQFGGQGQ